MTLKNTIGVPFDYDMVWAYNGNIAKIKNEGKFGYINLQGKVIAKPIYDEVWGLTNGVILVKRIQSTVILPKQVL
ncbi:MAG: WG repeat-containing protein [Sphingobacteriaceae bacterium]|nr:WG repeat-containing protein [Sphingobacteriaceae bacterium]